MKSLFNDNWSFLETDMGTSLAEAQKRKDEFRRVDLPHDWLIYDSEDLYRDGTGWYRKEFDPSDVGYTTGKKCFLIFDAVYMDSTYYLNGEKIGEWKYGYSRHSFDISDKLLPGKNVLYVSADFQNPNSRWYSGAGIIRDVFIDIRETIYIEDVYIHTEKITDNEWKIKIAVEHTGGKAGADVISTISMTDAEGLKIALKDGDESGEYIAEGVRVWDIVSPYLYSIKVELKENGSEKIYDKEERRIGFREVCFEPDRGLLLNARNIKLHGVCEHHDLGALGGAFNKDAMRRKFCMLKKWV